MKSLYNVAKSELMLKYGTKTFPPHHMNPVLAKEWYTFKVSARNTIRDSFVKTNLLPLIPINFTKIPRNALPPPKYLLDPSLKKSTIYHAPQLDLLR